MLKFDGEEERSKVLQESLREQFEYAAKVYEFSARIERTSWYQKNKIEKELSRVTGLLNVQACRLYRSIVEDCKRGEAFCSRLPLRSLYETLLAISFVLKPEVHLRASAKPDGKQGFKKDEDGNVKYSAQKVKNEGQSPTTLLSREFRATLYAAQPFFAADETAKEYEKDPELQEFAAGMRAQVDPVGIFHYEKLLGEGWSYVCRKGKYSGLQVKDLASLLDPLYLTWYATSYNIDSGIAHGASAHLLLSEDGKAFETTSKEGAVYVTLQGAVLLFIGIMVEMQDHINFGPESGAELEKLRAEYAKAFDPRKRKH